MTVLVVRNWWRRDGHALVPEDLSAEHLVIGTGAHGQMWPDQDTVQQLKARGVTEESLPTRQTARRYGELEPLGRLQRASGRWRRPPSHDCPGATCLERS